MIGRKKSRDQAREILVKYITYFFIIHVLFFSIIFNTAFFHYLAILIILTGFAEIFLLFRRSDFRRKYFFFVFLFLFLVFSAGFYRFSQMEKGILLFTFLVLSIFDAFSQISGQLMGRRKIFPAVSPGKTYEGFIGGALIAVASSLLLRGLIETQIFNTLILAAGIVIFAFAGDMATSLYKRKYNVKDFSNLLPGHGGFLDRFDSLVAGGAFIAWLSGGYFEKILF